MIHPTAIVDPKARLHSSVRVGPYAIIDADVELGEHCVVGPHVYLTGVTKIGAGNHFHAGCVIGDAPQDLKYDGAPTRVRIGERNVFRENCTVHRATKPDGETVVGSNNFLMVNSHVAHNCEIGNHVILANGALLGGHVTVQDRAFLSGNCVVHQFVRIGTLSMMQGGSGTSQDLPPFTVAKNINQICGLNMVGLRRAGFDSGQRLELKRLYHALFRSGKKFSEALTAAEAEFSGAAAKLMLEFCRGAKRGISSDVGSKRTAEEGAD